MCETCVFNLLEHENPGTGRSCFLLHPTNLFAFKIPFPSAKVLLLPPIFCLEQFLTTCIIISSESWAGSTLQAWRTLTPWTTKVTLSHFIAAKHGQATALTFRRYSELESYHCDECEHDPWEVAAFNYDDRSGNFSDHGNSGFIILSAEGKIVDSLHSGIPKGLYSHVTYGTPGHFVFDQIKGHYLDAVFVRCDT